ncbi:MAG: hypothetical protein IT361_03750 [Gemmatimonadaceae bacterium]|nr:hypothetical protein [Gemmatimonadaceae bacterium]
MRATYPAVLVATSVTLVATAMAPNATRAQAPATTRSYVQVVRLKPEMVTEWMTLPRTEVIPAQKKAGIASRITLATQVGNAFEYFILTPFPTWAAMDGDAPLVRALGAEGAAQLNAKLRRCILTQASYMTNRQDSLTIDPGPALVWRVVLRKILPGKMPEYLAWHRAEVLPAMQKAKAAGKIAGSTVAVRGAGAASGEFTVVTYHNTFAELQAGDPITQVLGAQAATAINAKNALYSTPVRVDIRRRVADLSY